MEVVASGPENMTEFWTVKFSESMVCDISSTFTSGGVLDNRGYKPTNDVYLQPQTSNSSVNTQVTSKARKMQAFRLESHLFEQLSETALQIVIAKTENKP